MTTNLQVLESDQQNEGNLTYVATENEWTKLIDAAGLANDRRNSQDEEKASMDGANGVGSNHGNYSVISIMGPQSSGKSTILNKLFGCRFDVMDHTRGRHQVTTGIWMGICEKANDLLIMDLEGTDALERKKNRGNFERQTSLMALTLSEVLIVNMWASDIGRAAGMNVDTLKSIIQANLRLFAPNAKTRLLFLIREQNPDESQFGVTPAKILQESVTKVVRTIWNELEKPQSFENSTLDDLFDISFFFMPPLVYYKDLFDQRVRELYSRFTNPQDPNFYFNTTYHRAKSVPAEGLYTWTKQIWEAVSKDESLNIPDQQKLLATYRCEHALAEAFALFSENSQAIVREMAQSQYVTNFGSRMDDIIELSLKQYRETANKYDKETAQIKYDELVDRIEMKVLGLFQKQLEYITTETIENFSNKLKKGCKQNNNENKCVDDLNTLVTETAQEVRKDFSHSLDESMISSKNDELTNKELYWSKMMNRLRETIKSVQNEQWMMLLKENEKLADEKVLWNISQLLKNPNQNTWKDISTLRIEYHGQSLRGHIIRKMQNLMFTEKEIEEKVDSLREKVDELIIEQIKQFVTRFDRVMQERFDLLFNKESESSPSMTTSGNTTNGGSGSGFSSPTGSSGSGIVYVPRDWSNPSLDVRTLYTSVKTECLSMLEYCRNIILEGNKDLNLREIKLDLLKSSDIDRIESTFNRFADNEFRNAEERVRRIQLGVSGILPNNPVTWAIFLFFAWNEIWSMLTNPLYLILFLFGGGILLIVYQAHTLGFDVQTVAMQMGTRMFSKVMNILQELQQSHMHAVNQQQDSRSRFRNSSAINTSNDNVEMTSRMTRDGPSIGGMNFRGETRR